MDKRVGETMNLLATGGILIWAGLALGQPPATRDLHLRGDRFKPLSYDQLTPAHGADLPLRVRGGRSVALQVGYTILL